MIPGTFTFDVHTDGAIHVMFIRTDVSDPGSLRANLFYSPKALQSYMTRLGFPLSPEQEKAVGERKHISGMQREITQAIYDSQFI